MIYVLYARLRENIVIPVGENAAAVFIWEYRGQRHTLSGLYRLSSRMDWQRYEFGFRYINCKPVIDFHPMTEQLHGTLLRLPLEFVEEVSSF